MKLYGLLSRIERALINKLFMAHTYINERHRKYAEKCMKAIEETTKKHYTAEQMLARCLRNLGIEETADQLTDKNNSSGKE